MTHTVLTPSTADAGALRTRRLRRVLVAATLASGAGALGVARIGGGAESADGGTSGHRLYLSLQSDDRLERAACEHVACPPAGTGGAIPRRESVQRTRSITLVWSAPTRTLEATPPPAP